MRKGSMMKIVRDEVEVALKAEADGSGFDLMYYNEREDIWYSVAGITREGTLRIYTETDLSIETSPFKHEIRNGGTYIKVEYELDD